MSFDLRDVDMSAVQRLITGTALPTDSIAMSPQRIVRLNVSREAVAQHTTTTTFPQVAECHHCRRTKPVLSGIPIAVQSVDNKPRYIMAAPWVCSYGCMLAAAELLGKCQRQYQDSYRLCMALYDDINPGGYVAKAPAYTMLQCHGGTMSDQEYDNCTGPCMELHQYSIKASTHKVQVIYQ